MDISNRHRLIIEAIISMYMLSGEPIASQMLMNELNIAVSSATLRNEMALLTKLGYLTQPHVAAGRVPTNKAYRYYVDNMSFSKELGEKEKQEIKYKFNKLDTDSQKLLFGASKLLSDILKVGVVISQPTDIDMKFANFRLLKTGRFNIVVLAVTAQGDVHTRVVRINQDIKDEEISQISQLINSKLCFLSYADIDNGYYEMLSERLSRENMSFAQILTGVISLIQQAGNQNFYISGHEHLLNVTHSEKGIGNLLRLLSNEEKLKAIITPNQQEISVVFADELPISDIENACFISTNFYGASGVRGTLAIIASEAIDYEDVFLKIDYFARLLTQTISGA